MSKSHIFDNYGELNHHAHLNLLAVELPGEKPVILQFNGESIPCVCEVVRQIHKEYKSKPYTMWYCQLNEGVYPCVFVKDSTKGLWFPQKEWDIAIDYLLSEFGKKLHLI